MLGPTAIPPAVQVCNVWGHPDLELGVFLEKPNLTWMFPKIGGFPPKSSILIGFSIIFTIHFGVPLFLETSTWPMAKLSTFWDYIFSRENKPFKLLFQGPGRLSEKFITTYEVLIQFLI